MLEYEYFDAVVVSLFIILVIAWVAVVLWIGCGRSTVVDRHCDWLENKFHNPPPEAAQEEQGQ